MGREKLFEIMGRLNEIFSLCDTEQYARPCKRFSHAFISIYAEVDFRRELQVAWEYKCKLVEQASDIQTGAFLQFLAATE